MSRDDIVNYVIGMVPTRVCFLCESKASHCRSKSYLDMLHCSGDLNYRPSWCPLHEVKSSDVVPSNTLCNEIWVEENK